MARPGRYASVDEIGEYLERGVAKIAIALILEIDRQLRMSPGRGGTPVRTRHARANWVASIATPFAGDASGASQAEHDGGIAAILQYRLRMGSLWISNPVPYIRRLNDGWSQQAPAGFIERAIDLAIQTVEKKFGAGSLGFSLSAYRNDVGGDMAGNLADAYSPVGGD